MNSEDNDVRLQIKHLFRRKNIMCNELKSANAENSAAGYISSENELKLLLKATEKSLTVKIDPAEQEKLKENGYCLCFAKKVGDFDYNVIWKSMDKFLANNIFSWVPLFQVFGTNTYKNGVKVVASTDVIDIGLGEKTTLDKNGILSAPVTGGDENAINVDNEYGDIHFAISQVTLDENGDRQSTPIYVSDSVAILGSSEFEPVEKVQVWFQKDAETSTMFTTMRSNAIEIDLTSKSAGAIEYKDGKWSII